MRSSHSGFLVWAATGSQEHSHPAPPPAPVSALCSSSLPLSGQPGAGGEISPNPCSLAAAAGDPVAPWWRQLLAAALSAAALEESVSGPENSGSPNRRHFFSYTCVLAHRPLNLKSTELGRNPRKPGWAAEPVEKPGRRRKARPFAQPHLWDSAQRAGAGRGDGVLTPAPPLSPPGINQEPPLPQRPLPRPSRCDPRRQSHWKKPRPPAGYLQTPSPRAAANCCRLLRMRDGEQGACA